MSRKIWMAGATVLVLAGAAGAASADPRWHGDRRWYGGYRAPIAPGYTVRRYYRPPVVVPRVAPYPYAYPYPYGYAYPPPPAYYGPAPWLGFGFGGPGWSLSFGF